MGRSFRAIVSVGMMFAIAALTALVSIQVRPSRQSSDPNLGSVVAFARVYGVVRFFYPSDAATRVDWDRFAPYGVERVRNIRDARALAAELERLFSPLGPGIQVRTTLTPVVAPRGGSGDAGLVAWRYLGPGATHLAGRFSPSYSPYFALRTHRPYSARPNVDAAEIANLEPVAGAHADFELGMGLRARVPLTLTDAQARETSASIERLNALRTKLAAVSDPSQSTALDVRLADVAVLWNFFRHFYPYWPETGVDWDSRLLPRLTEARDATSRAEEMLVLRRLVADARDGHGHVSDVLSRQPSGFLPVRVTVLGDALVVTASDVPDRVPLGAVISSIDGVPAKQRVATAADLASGTTQWKAVRAAGEVASGPQATFASLTFDDGRAPRTEKVQFRASEPGLERRPNPVSELEPRLWYVDLSRAKMAEIQPKLDALARARGVVFDLRGYPTDAGAAILPHLVGASESDRWMHVAKITGPFGQIAGWQDIGWNLVPRAPRVGGKVVFLTDGRAISYAESVMGYIGDKKLATIIGANTAGTNGNVASFDLPGGYVVAFTGMRNTRHDGQSPFHLVGVPPDIAVTPTIAGVRAGRDEVLARAVSVVHAAGQSAATGR